MVERISRLGIQLPLLRSGTSKRNRSSEALSCFDQLMIGKSKRNLILIPGFVEWVIADS